MVMLNGLGRWSGTERCLEHGSTPGSRRYTRQSPWEGGGSRRNGNRQVSADEHARNPKLAMLKVPKGLLPLMISLVTNSTSDSLPFPYVIVALALAVYFYCLHLASFPLFCNLWGNLESRIPRVRNHRPSLCRWKKSSLA